MRQCGRSSLLGAWDLLLAPVRIVLSHSATQSLSRLNNSTHLKYTVYGASSLLAKVTSRSTKSDFEIQTPK